MRRNFHVYLYVCLLLILLAVLIVPSTSPSVRAAAQSGVKRWVVIYHLQNALPAGAARSVEQAGGVVTKELPEVGALVAESSDPNFAAAMALDPKVSDVGEDVEVKMIPSPEEMRVGFAGDPAAQAGGPVEQPGDDTQTGSEPFYPFQWDKKRMRASNQG